MRRWEASGASEIATGIGFLAAGLAILARVRARLAATLLTAMIASFTLLIHIPMLLKDHSSHFNWTELAINLADLGAAWVLADSLPRITPNRRHPR